MTDVRRDRYAGRMLDRLVLTKVVPLRGPRQATSPELP